MFSNVIVVWAYIAKMCLVFCSA